MFISCSLSSSFTSLWFQPQEVLTIPHTTAPVPKEPHKLPWKGQVPIPGASAVSQWSLAVGIVTSPFRKQAC